MAGRYVRASAYRHVFGEKAKPEKQYTGIVAPASSESNGLAVNTKFVAMNLPGGGGPVNVLNLEKTGRQSLPEIFKVMVHSKTVTDMCFSPFYDNILASGSDDATVKVTQFPIGGLTADVTTATVNFENLHHKKIVGVTFNPTANNVLATVGDTTVRIWDVTTGQCAKYVDFKQTDAATGEEKLVEPAMAEWNEDGSLMVVATKNKKFRVYDPRDSSGGTDYDLSNWANHIKMFFCEKYGQIIGVGSPGASREYAIWDVKNLAKPIHKSQVDTSSGAIMTHYDPDNQVFYMAGKGSPRISYYEIINESPYLAFLSSFEDNAESNRGIAWMPKRGLDVSKCEIARAYRLTTKSIEPVSFKVPRKSDVFQADLYPETFAGVPSNDSKAWFGGESLKPVKTSMKPGSTAVARVEVALAATRSIADYQKEIDELKAKVAQLEAENATLKAK